MQIKETHLPKLSTNISTLSTNKYACDNGGIGSSPKVPKANFNNIQDSTKRSNFNSPNLSPKSFAHVKSSLPNEISDSHELSIINAEKQQTALILPHLMLSQSTNPPITTSLPPSSWIPFTHQNSFRVPNNQTKVTTSNGENVDIYEDPSEHYSIIGRPTAVTSFQTSTPVRNTISTGFRDIVECREDEGMHPQSTHSSSALGSCNMKTTNNQSSNFRHGYGIYSNIT